METDSTTSKASVGWARSDEAALESWVRHDLARRYAAALTEPVPAELLALLPRH